MIYYTVLLLLLITLVTVVLANQPVKGDASEGQSNPGGCISDWRGLKKAYLDHQSSADVENSIFDFYPSDAFSYGVLVMFYDVGPPLNTSTSGRRECCQRGSKDCIIHFIYRFRIFRDIHPPLLYVRAGHLYSVLASYSFRQLCWALPPLCNNRSAENIQDEFSQQFVGLVQEESPFTVETSAGAFTASNNNNPSSLFALTVIPILLFATVGMVLVLYMHHSWGVVGKVLAHSQVTRHTMRATMLASWVMFPCAMQQFFAGTRKIADVVQKERPLTHFPDVYGPQVTAGYSQFGSFLAILLLEAPFLCVFFFRKFTDLHNRNKQLSKTDCHLCYWITVLCDTLGGIGVVAAAQITSVYLFYNALYLIVSPIFAIAWVSNGAAYMIVFLVCITMLLQVVSSCCKMCSFEGIFKGLAFLMLGLLCITINYYAVALLRRDKRNNYSTARGLLASLLCSIIIGGYGYAVKKLFFQKIEDTERKNLESVPLIRKL